MLLRNGHLLHVRLNILICRKRQHRADRPFGSTGKSEKEALLSLISSSAGHTWHWKFCLVLIINGQYNINVSSNVYTKLNWDVYCFLFSTENKDCMHSTIYTKVGQERDMTCSDLNAECLLENMLQDNQKHIVDFKLYYVNDVFFGVLAIRIRVLFQKKTRFKWNRVKWWRLHNELER